MADDLGESLGKNKLVFLLRVSKLKKTKMEREELAVCERLFCDGGCIPQISIFFKDKDQCTDCGRKFDKGTLMEFNCGHYGNYPICGQCSFKITTDSKEKAMKIQEMRLRERELELEQDPDWNPKKTMAKYAILIGIVAIFLAKNYESFLYDDE